MIFGVLAIVAAVLALYLPETLHRALPLTIEEVERWPRHLTKDEKEGAKKRQEEDNKDVNYQSISNNSG